MPSHIQVIAHHQPSALHRVRQSAGTTQHLPVRVHDPVVGVVVDGQHGLHGFRLDRLQRLQFLVRLGPEGAHFLGKRTVHSACRFALEHAKQGVDPAGAVADQVKLGARVMPVEVEQAFDQFTLAKGQSGGGLGVQGVDGDVRVPCVFQCVFKGALDAAVEVGEVVEAGEA